MGRIKIYHTIAGAGREVDWRLIVITAVAWLQAHLGHATQQEWQCVIPFRIQTENH